MVTLQSCFNLRKQNKYYIEDIYPGFYSITIIDGIGYTFDVSFSIFETDVLNPYIWEDGDGLSTYNNSDWTYQWFYMGQILFSETNFEINPQNGTGVYSVEVTDENGCLGISQYNYESSDLNLDKEEFFYVYPNPSSEIINLKSSINSREKYKIILTNNLGQVVLDKKCSDLNNLEINIQNLEPGIYFINIEGDTDLNKKLSFIKTKN